MLVITNSLKVSSAGIRNGNYACNKIQCVVIATDNFQPALSFRCNHCGLSKKIYEMSSGKLREKGILHEILPQWEHNLDSHEKDVQKTKFI